MLVGIGSTIPKIANLPGPSRPGGGGGSPFEYTAIDNNFSMEFDGTNYITTGVDISGTDFTLSYWVNANGSYAGFQVANIISRDHRFKAACAQRGVYNLVTFCASTDIPMFAIDEMKGEVWDNLNEVFALSPVGRAKEIKTPLLMIHSENDYRVPIAQAEELFGALKIHNKEVELVRYPRDGHELSRSGEPDHEARR